MKRSNQIIAGVVLSVFALIVLAVIVFVDNIHPTTLIWGTFAVLVGGAAYNFSPVTMREYFGQARGFYDKRDDDDR